MPENNQKDPSYNVSEMIESSIIRLDDLRHAEIKRLDEKIDANDVKYQIQFSAAKEAVGIASIAQEKAMAAALEGTKEAIVKNDANTDKRFDLLSEKIDSIAETISKNTGAQGIYVTHSDLSVEMEKLRNSFETMLRPVITFMNTQGGQQKGLNMGWVYLIGGVSLISTLIAIFMTLNNK